MGKHYKKSKRKVRILPLGLAFIYAIVFHLPISVGEEFPDGLGKKKEEIPKSKQEQIINTLEVAANHMIDNFEFEASTGNISSKNEVINEDVVEEEPTLSEEELKKLEQDSIYEEYLRLYSTYYHFDSAKVIEVARLLTNDFTLDFSEVNGTKAYDLDNPEAAILTFVYQLKRGGLNDPNGKIKYSIDDLLLDYDMELMDDNKMLSNGLSISEFIGHVCDLLKLDKVLVYAISSGETGWQTSGLAKYDNNFGGMTPDGDNYLGFQTPESGAIAFVENLNLNYFEEGLTTLESIASVYCPGNPGYVDFIYDVIYDVNKAYDDLFLPTDETLTLKK